MRYGGAAHDIRVNGEWKWLFRAVDKQGRTVDFLLTHRRNAKAARRFLANQNWPPHIINTDKNPAYGEARRLLKRDDPDVESIEHRQAKYLNNRIEADHGPIKRLCRATLGFKSMKTGQRSCGRRLPPPASRHKPTDWLDGNCRR
jgi:IS6 family transposase